MMQPHLRPRSNLTDASWLWMFGRVREGLTPDAAEAELTALTTASAREHGQADSPRAITAMRVSPHSGLPGGEGRAMLAFMGMLLGAAGLVLVIAGVNVATMLSARYVARQREMAVRAALGAGRLRLLRHLLTEVLMLFLLGAAGGFLVAVAATTALERIPLPENVPVSLELSPDMRVLGFALALSLVSGLVFGLAPALRTARKDIVSPLRDDSVRGGVGRSLLNRGLVVGQLALSLVLLVVAGLFLRALDHGQRVDPGFELQGVMTTTLEPESWGYDEPQARAFQRRLRERVEAMDGVTSVSFTGRVPLMMGRSPDDIAVEGTGEVPIDHASVDVNYFDVLQIPVLQGRAFMDGDAVGAERVAVVNETLARRVWPDGSALGRTFRFRDEVTTVVGVVRDAKYASLDEQTPSFVYVPLAQIWQPTQTLLARTVRDPAELTREVQDAVWSIDPQVPRPRVSTLERATSIVLLPQRAAAIVTGVLGGAGLLLAAVGLYGLMTFAASRRTREIGIRVALGATSGTVLRMMLADGLRLAAAGIAVGLVLAALAARVLSPYLFDLSPLDPVAFVAMACVFVLVALLASYLPARRAAGADPLDALRLD
jgi:predicted permease